MSAVRAQDFSLLVKLAEYVSLDKVSVHLPNNDKKPELRHFDQEFLQFSSILHYYPQAKTLQDILKHWSVVITIQSM